MIATLASLGSSVRADPKVDDHDRFVRRTIAVVIASLGAASVIVGTAHAVGSVEDRHEADGLCTPTCDDKGAFLSNRATNLAHAAELLIGSGLAAIGIGALVWLTAPGVRVVPVVTPAETGAMLELRF